MTRISQRLDNEQQTGYVSIHPEDAQRIGVAEGEPLLLSSRRGGVEAPARVTESVSPGTLFLPIHFGENPTNVLTNAEADHLEYWGGWPQLEAAFGRFLSETDGPVVACADDPGSAAIGRSPCNTLIST